MIAFLKLYWMTILICIGLGAILFAIVWKLIDNKKKGKSSCGCGCTNCAMSEICHKKK
jgi:hypothetical protein